MSAEAWPTEAAATAAVDAVARKAFDLSRERLLETLPPLTGAQLSDWQDIGPVQQLAWRNQVLPLVWAALEALPDPRHAAWEMGYMAAINVAGPISSSKQVDNPFPFEF